MNMSDAAQLRGFNLAVAESGTQADELLDRLRAGSIDLVYCTHRHYSGPVEGDTLEHIDVADDRGRFVFDSSRLDGGAVADLAWQLTRVTE